VFCSSSRSAASAAFALALVRGPAPSAVARGLIGTNNPSGDDVSADDRGYLSSFLCANDSTAGFDNTKGEPKP
jgi:hypothetical protein